MELEEAIKRLEILNAINKKQLENGDMFLYEEETKEEIQAIDRIIKYIKEESIPRVVVEEKIEEVRQLENVSIADIIENQKEFCIDVLQEILNRGE